MDRLEEFNGIIDKIKTKENEIEAEEPLLRNRNSAKPREIPEVPKESKEINNFSKSFISECSLIVSPLIVASHRD